MRSAVLFDIDGTLVDSNYLHVHAWYKAFTKLGRHVDSWTIHRAIGMDGSALVESLVGHASEQLIADAKDLHSQYYRDLSPMLRRFRGAREILAEVEARGIEIVLATSAPADELEMLREVLDQDSRISAVTSAEDVDVAKPEPHIVFAALDRAGVPAQRAVFVGDTVWDVYACNKAEVDCVGVLSGGVSRSELVAAGAIAVYSGVDELAEHFAASPLARLE